jgi:predicted RNase H-like HicB family nuclease
MKVVYPVVIDLNDFVVDIPDCQIGTEGEDLADAVAMARDAISIWCVTEQDAGRQLPRPSEFSKVACQPGEIMTLVDADLDAYRVMLTIRERAAQLEAAYPAPVEEEFCV